MTSPLLHYSLEDSDDGLRFTIPSETNWIWIIVLGLWLIFWVASEVFIWAVGIPVLVEMLSSLAHKQSIMNLPGNWVVLFILLVLGVWTIGGMFNLYGFLWQLVGREVIEINEQLIRVRRLVFGRGCTKKYIAKRIRNMHVTSGYRNRWLVNAGRSSPVRLSDGFIAFDYERKVIYFGSGIAVEEARQILSQVQQRFPQYRIQ